MCQIPDRPDFPGKTHVRFTSNFKLKFLTNYSFSFLHQGLNPKPYSYKVSLGKKLLGFDPCIRAIRIRKLQKVLLKTFHLETRTHFLHYYRFHFCHRGFNGKLHTFEGAFGAKIIDFDHCINNFMVAKIRKKAISLNISQYSHSFFSVTIGLIPSSRSQ